jgi:endonuclease/exonuclease/phosphatase family metal-dependent hydrolase
LADAYREVHPQAQRGPGTIHGFDGHPDHGRIDWILTTAEFRSVEAGVDRSHDDGRYPSDHFPVTAVLRWPSQVTDADGQTTAQSASQG